MKPTRLGLGAMAMAALTLLTAASTGNNLIYLLYGTVSASLVCAALLGRLNLRGVTIGAEPPAQVFRAQPFTLPLRLFRAGWWPAYGVEILWQGSTARAERVPAGGSARVEVRGALPHRGNNRLDDLTLESSFPLGLFRFRRVVSDAAILALPRPKPVREAREVSAAARATGRPTLRKGAGDELYGIRDFAPGDDARILNWKLSARMGRPLVNEYCAAQDDKITVTVDSGRGEGAEAAIERAASACRFYVEAGAEVRLETAEEAVDYGRGLAHLDRLLAALARLGDGGAPRPSGVPAPLPFAKPEDSPALRRLTLGLMLLVYLGMFLVDDISQRLLLLAAPGLALGWLVQEKRWSPIPGWVSNAASAGVLGYTVLVDWRQSGVTVSNTHLLLYLLLNRSLMPLTRDELNQVFLICFLAFFLISGLTISVWYFLLFCGYAAACAVWLGLASGAPWARHKEWTRGLAGALAASVLAGGLLFAVTPRVEGLRRINPFLAAGIDKLSVQNGSVAGFTDDVSLGFFGRIKKSSARILRIKPSPPPGQDQAPELHVRGSSFDRFDGRRWSRSPADFAVAYEGRRTPSLYHRVWAARRPGGLLRFPAVPARRDAPVYDITIYPMNLSVAFTVGTPWVVEGADTDASFDQNDGVQFATPYQASGAHYKVYPSAQPGFLAAPGVEEALRPRFLQVPADPDGKVAALSRRITSGAPDDAAKIRAVEQYLQKRYDYSLYSDGKSTSLEDFLFKTRKGNCEYFATAGVILLRHAGVPARLVTGFLAGDWNEYGKFYDVRQGEAHAWLEAFVPGHGWRTADPTPPQSVIAAGFEELTRKLSHWAASLETQWYRHVIGYDQYEQHDAFRRLGTAFSPESLRGMARGAGWALALGALIAGLMTLRDRLSAAPKRTPTLLERAEEAVARAGLSRAPHLTAREFAAAVAGPRPEMAAILRLAELHYLEAFSPRRLAEDERAEAESLLADLRAAARRGEK